MKKIVAALAGLTLSLSACQDLQEKDFMKTTALTLTASVEQPVGTRTLIAGDSQVWWEKGDEIKVFAGTKSARFTSDLSSSAATADFTGSLDCAWTEGSTLWAVYPYSEGAVLDGETLAVELPAVQVARAQSFAKGMNLSVARTTSPGLQFYNVGGGLCFTLTQEGITKVVFEGLNGETLAGKVKLAFQDERPVVQEVSEGSTSVTLAAPEGTTLEKGVWYYIVALPGALEKGFTLTFYKGTAVAKKTFAKAVTVKRSIFGEVQDADEGASFIPDTDENIRFKDAKVKEIVVRYFDTGKDGELSYKEAAAVRSFFVDKALTRAEGEQVSVFAGTGITSFDEIQYFTGLTKIEAGTFEGCTALTSVTIPENTTEIGANAFKGCTNLQSIIVLAPTPPTIGVDAFADTNNCPILVPAGTTDAYTAAWGEYAPRIEGSQPDNEIWYTSTDGQVVEPTRYEYVDAFGADISSNVYVDGKGIITFTGPVTKIGESAFSALTGDRHLASIKIPKTVTTIGPQAFNRCVSLTEVSLPEGITDLYAKAFFHCTGLTGITLPQTLKYIGEDAFGECEGLSEIVLPEGLTTIDVRAFTYCTGLARVVIPTSVTQIGDRAFNQNQSLTNVVVPGPATVGSYAFGGCNKLLHVTLSSGVKSIGATAFAGCTGLLDITVLATTPPVGGDRMFISTNNCPIYVPAGSVEAYKTAEYWSDYADRIQADLSEMRTALENELMECQKMVVYLTQRLQQLPSSEQKARLAEQIDELAQVLNVVSQALLAATTQEQLTNIRYQIQDMQVQIAVVDEQLRQLGA